ncbi:hypothetical protein [Mycolicibacterium sp. XJ1819]
MRRRPIAATALVGAALLLAGCGSSDEPQPTVTVTEPAPTTTGHAPSAPTPAPRAGVAEPARPGLDQCVRLAPTADGRYQIYDAGTAVVVFADGRLTLESVTPADGWTHRVDDQRPDEVEIEFRRGAEELDLEVEIDDGRLEVTVCNDKD